MRKFKFIGPLPSDNFDGIWKWKSWWMGSVHFIPRLISRHGSSEMCLGGAVQAHHILSLCVALVGDSKVTFHTELEIHSLAHTCIHNTRNWGSKGWNSLMLETAWCTWSWAHIAHTTWPGYVFTICGPWLFSGPIFRLFVHCHLKHCSHFLRAISPQISSQWELLNPVLSIKKILRLVHLTGPDWAMGLALRVSVVRGGWVTHCLI